MTSPPTNVLPFFMAAGEPPQVLLKPDPVIEAYKKDIDRTLLRENLKLTGVVTCPARVEGHAGFEGAHDDACVRGAFEVKTDEVAAIERHDNATVHRGKLQHLCIRHSPACVTALPHRHDIVTQTPQLDNDRFRAGARIEVYREPSPEAYRFGSRARGDARRDSDLDLLIITDSRIEPVGSS